ncbi:MAG TPA: serine/threonine-protein kinase [Pirellulales bacterium]|nr:serine/threonine-protein kinase [Pirellulales bacterium]
MKDPEGAKQLPSCDPGSQADGAARRSWLARWRESWRGLKELSASELAEGPSDLALRANSVLSRAYSEYCRREATGEPIDRKEFCGEFASYQQPVARMLVIHDYLKAKGRLSTNSELLEGWPEAGEMVGGFKLIDGLGLGAFARVYVAAEPAVAERRVAVKVSVEGASEADILGKLSHPNIVQILSVGRDEQSRWGLICMPYLGQATLDDVICQVFPSPEGPPRRAQRLLQAIESLNRVGEPVEPVPPDPRLAKWPYVEGVVHLTAQLADALAHAHAKGICHRDLKPSNVLLDPGGKPMLLDFNLALDEQALGRRLGGTLPYMAPEQLYATVLEPQTGGAADPRSDLFSLGVLAYELLCGSWPYGPILAGLPHDEFATELWERQRSGPVRLAERSRDVDPKVSSLIQRCLAFDPAERPQTALELAAALRQCLSPAQRARRWAYAHRGRVAAGAGIVVIAAGLSAYHFATRPPYAERELRAAEAAVAAGDGASASRHVEEAVHSDLRMELHGKAAECYYRIGKLAFDEKDYGRALEYLEHATHQGLDRWELWFYRGAANYRIAEYVLAESDFIKAQLRPAPAGFPAASARLMACMGDCALRRGDARAAQAAYRAALQNNFDSVAVLNNMGRAASLNGAANGEHLIEAEKYLTLAIERAANEFADPRDPRLQPLFYNRAAAELKRSTSFTARKKCDPRAKRDIRIAIECGPDRAWPWWMAAGIYGWQAGEKDPAWRSAVDFTWEAIQRGAPFEQLEKDQFRWRLIEAVRRRPGFDDLLRDRVREKMDAPPVQLDFLDEILPE